jgi:hypothetical protein
VARSKRQIRQAQAGYLIAAQKENGSRAMPGSRLHPESFQRDLGRVSG